MKKTVLILGAGAQGNVVGTVLSRADDVGRIVLADIDTARADETARSIGSDRIQVARADVTAVEETAALMRRGEFDLVVNLAPPQFIPQAMKAALAAGRNYLDLSSVFLYEIDGLPFEQMQDAAAWEASGRIALINAGGAPGLTNIMAREGADRLDVIDRVEIKDYSLTTSDEYVPLWILSVYAIDCATEPWIWEDGRPRRVPIFSGEEVYEFPPPIGQKGKVYLHAHEEPVTIPLHLGKPVRYCDYKIGDPDIDSWRFLVERLRLMDETQVNVGGIAVRPRDLLLRMLPPTPSPQRVMRMMQEGRLASRCILTCDVTGTLGGRRSQIRLWTDSPDLAGASSRIPGASDISLLTSVPAAVFALMILRGQIGRTGV
ncbi:MAG TPA: saccharopine dehydrogenase NADP-binding domain-containing protein, partial [Candidatus Cryosericum sp.]|nr:saccharopine dehydrogenase NADP-binding domain-containing protein [Candidatus Cryosericum sp.]